MHLRLPGPGEGSLLFCPLHLGIRVSNWVEQCLTYVGKRQSKISFNSGCRSPWPTGLSQWPPQDSLPVHTRRVLQQREPFPSEDRGSNGVGRMMFTLEAETNERSLSLTEGKTLPAQGDRPGTGCVDPLSRGQDASQA